MLRSFLRFRIYACRRTRSQSRSKLELAASNSQSVYFRLLCEVWVSDASKQTSHREKQAKRRHGKEFKEPKNHNQFLFQLNKLETMEGEKNEELDFLNRASYE